MTRIDAERSSRKGVPQKTQTLKEHMKTHKKLEIGQILNGNTNGYRERRVEAPKAETTPSLNNPLNPEQQKTSVSAGSQNLTEQTQAKTETNMSKEVHAVNKNPITLNENGTYKVKLNGEPARTFYTEADAKNFVDNVTNKNKQTAAPAITLNERGTYDVKLKGEPTRTFSSEADAKKFLDNMSNNSKVTGQNTVKASASNLTPLNASKAPFSKKFWGEYKGDLKELSLNYNPELKTGEKILGNNAKQASKLSSLKEFFTVKNLKSTFKGKSGKWALIGAAVTAAGIGITAACEAGSSKGGYTTKYIEAPQGYINQLENYEKSHNTSDISYNQLRKLIA